MNGPAVRRPLKTRQYAWSRQLAHRFVRMRVTPNQMSIASIGIALCGAGAYWGASVASPLLRTTLLIAAAACIQLRLLSNMLDGLMAVEEHQKTATGALYNDFPDRIADILFLGAAGYAAGQPILGWACALVAVLTAYVRVLGASLGYRQNYCGPMAKPHRMFALTMGSVIAAFVSPHAVLASTLSLIFVGSGVTVFRRLSHLTRHLTENSHD